MSKNKKNYTLDFKHNEMITKINKVKNKLPIFQRKLLQIDKKLKNLKIKQKSNWTDNDFENYNKCVDDKKELEGKINNIENNDDMINYFVKTSKPLLSYYYDSCNQKKYEDNKEDDVSENNLSKYLNINIKKNKVNILTDFMEITDSKYIKKTKIDKNYSKCLNCNKVMTLIKIEGIMICENCGIQKTIILNSEKPSFKEPPVESTYFAYRKINHFNETLAQAQGKESTDIPEEILKQIYLEIKKDRIKNIKKLTSKKIKKYLKRIGQSKYYEHIPYIIETLCGKKPIYLNKELEQTLRIMFNDLETLFATIKNKNRKNFLNYNYTMYKLLEMLGEHEFKKHFTLLKSHEKLREHDVMMKKMCNILEQRYESGNVWGNFIPCM